MRESEAFLNGPLGQNHEPVDERVNISDLRKLYQAAFAGPPWYEQLSDEEVLRRLQANMSKPGFDSLIVNRGSKIAGALWYDTPSLDELEAEFQKPLRDFAEGLQEQTGITNLVWEREVIVDPAKQKQGIASQLRGNFLERLTNNYPQGVIVLTRMRDDNIGIRRIGEKFGFEQTSVSYTYEKENQDGKKQSITQRFWYKVIPPRAGSPNHS